MLVGPRPLTLAALLLHILSSSQMQLASGGEFLSSNDTLLRCELTCHISIYHDDGERQVQKMMGRTLLCGWEGKKCYFILIINKTRHECVYWRMYCFLRIFSCLDWEDISCYAICLQCLILLRMDPHIYIFSFCASCLTDNTSYISNYCTAPRLGTRPVLQSGLMSSVCKS